MYLYFVVIKALTVCTYHLSKANSMSCVNFFVVPFDVPLAISAELYVFKPEKLVSVIDLIKTDSLSIFESQT